MCLPGDLDLADVASAVGEELRKHYELLRKQKLITAVEIPAENSWHSTDAIFNTLLNSGFARTEVAEVATNLQGAKEMRQQNLSLNASLSAELREDLQGEILAVADWRCKATDHGCQHGREAEPQLRRLAEQLEGCEFTGERTYDRCVGICYLNGNDIAAELVRQGVARDCPRYSGGRYAEAEREAAGDGATIGDSYILPAYCLRY